MKPRRAKIVLLGIAGVVVVLGAVWALMRSGGGFPTATIQVTSYTNDNLGQILATVKVQNTCGRALAFYDYPEGTAWLDGDEIEPLYVIEIFSPTIVAAHHTGELHLLIPRPKGGAHTWHCWLSVFKPSAREKTQDWLIRKKIHSRLLYRLSGLLPGESGPRTNIESPMFTLPANVAAP